MKIQPKPCKKINMITATYGITVLNFNTKSVSNIKYIFYMGWNSPDLYHYKLNWFSGRYDNLDVCLETKKRLNVCCFVILFYNSFLTHSKIVTQNCKLLQIIAIIIACNGEKKMSSGDNAVALNVKLWLVHRMKKKLKEFTHFI